MVYVCRRATDFAKMKTIDVIELEKKFPVGTWVQSNHRDLWKEVKQIKGRGNIIAANVENLSDENDIAELFSNKYCDLYNSVPLDHPEMS